MKIFLSITCAVFLAIALMFACKKEYMSQPESQNLFRPDRCRDSNVRVKIPRECNSSCATVYSTTRSANNYFLIKYRSNGPDTVTYLANVFIPDQFNYTFSTGNGFYPCVDYTVSMAYTCQDGSLSAFSNEVTFKLRTTLCP